MNKVFGAIVAFLLSGCACVTVSERQRAKVDALHRDNISWSGNPPEGYRPVVSMSAAIGWAILPGAGQIFIADKIGDAYREERLSCSYSPDRVLLNTSGTLMLAVSWFPWIYDVTLPFGIGGVIQDVNRINNIALIEYLEKSK